MEDTSMTSANDAATTADFARTLTLQRERVLEFSGGHRRTIDQFETELAAQLGQISEELTRGRRELGDGQTALAAERERLEAAQEKLRQDERALLEQRRKYEADADELTHQRQRVQEKLADLDRQLEAAEDEKSRTKLQRRRIAQELKEERDKQRQEFERERLDIERARNQLGEAGALAAELAEFRQRAADLEEKQVEFDSLRQQCDDLKRQTAEIDALLEHSAELERQLAERPATADAGPELAALAAERDRLAAQLAEAQTRLAEAERRPPSEGDDGKLAEELADMQRRYQLAMEDVRETKKKNAELEKRLAAGGAQPSPAVAAGGGMDWEAQKRRLLAELEADEGQEGEESEEDRAERLKIRDVVAKTDAVLAAKEQEIEELKQLLDAQSNNIGEMAVGAQAIAEMLNQDEVVTAERERLVQLQKEWEEKLRQAEIDLSVQRAKIARERAEIEELQRQFKQQQAEHGDDGSPGDAKSKKPPRGRWLTRLGLKEQDEE